MKESLARFGQSFKDRAVARRPPPESATLELVSKEAGIVVGTLDIAEDMAERQIPMTMSDWEERLNRFIAATDREILQDAGKVSAEIAKAHALSEFEKYRIVQDRLYESDFDKAIKALEKKGGEA